MNEEPLFEIDSTVEVERQVDATFAPLYSLIAENHHKAIVRVERDMINAIKFALRQLATEPVTPNPSNWPWSSGERLMPFLSPEEQRELPYRKWWRSSPKGNPELGRGRCHNRLHGEPNPMGRERGGRGFKALMSRNMPALMRSANIATIASISQLSMRQTFHSRIVKPT